jgi:hypothetical protein
MTKVKDCVAAAEGGEIGSDKKREAGWAWCAQGKRLIICDPLSTGLLLNSHPPGVSCWFLDSDWRIRIKWWREWAWDKQKATPTWRTANLERLESHFTKTSRTIWLKHRGRIYSKLQQLQFQELPDLAGFNTVDTASWRWRDGNAAKNIFKMALATALIHLDWWFSTLEVSRWWWRWGLARWGRRWDDGYDWPRTARAGRYSDIEMSIMGARMMRLGGEGEGGSARVGAVGSGNKKWSWTSACG